MKKEFIKGFVIGSLIFGSFSTFAASTYEAIVATFPIIINGETWESNKPAVVINGSTYLPLKSIGDALDVNVNWNSELNRVEIGESKEIQANIINTYSRLNPAPIGMAQSIKISRYTENYTANVCVKEIFRGKNAWDKIKAANRFNYEPKDGYEYILAKIEINISDVKDDKAIFINDYDFACYSSNNVEYDTPSVVEPEPKLYTSLYDGGTTAGYVTFQVKQTDKTPKIVFGQDYDGTSGIWFSLETDSTNVDDSYIKTNTTSTSVSNNIYNNTNSTYDEDTSDDISISYVGNKNTKKLHRLSCSSVKKMSSSNKVYFNSKSDASGYTACKICKP